MDKAQQEQLQKLGALRWKARTDLLYLARLLGYDKLTEYTHRPVADTFQKFPIPNKTQISQFDKWEKGIWHYKPILDMDDLPGSRRVLLIDSRGFGKSTINVICHTIQWIINYPDISILIVQANLSKVKTVLRELKSHFQRNETFRALFPEHCPIDPDDDFGTQDMFTSLARRDWKRKEPTVTGLSLDAGTAGLHYHVMKFSDIVERENTTTPEQINNVISRFGMFRNLLDHPRCWIDVEGTRYGYSDLYGNIMEADKSIRKEGKSPEYRIFCRGCYVKETGNDPPRFTPDELEMKDKLDARGLPISWWPERFPTDILERERLDKSIPDSELTFATQRKNNPMDVTGATAFPIEKFRTISRSDYERIPIAYRQVTVDTANTATARSNYTAISIGAWSGAGKLYIEDIIHGKFLPEEIVFWLFAIHKRYGVYKGTDYRYLSDAPPSQRPQMYFIEKTAYTLGLMPTINRAQDTGKLYIPEDLRKKYGKEWDVGSIRLPITLMDRETQQSKQDRIRLSLQVPYASGDLVFLDDISCLDYAKQEFARFPDFHTDDIIDTVADHFRQKEYFGRLTPRPTIKQVSNEAWERLLGIHDPDGEHLINDGYAVPLPYPTDHLTGCL